MKETPVKQQLKYRMVSFITSGEWSVVWQRLVLEKECQGGELGWFLKKKNGSHLVKEGREMTEDDRKVDSIC